MQTHCDHQPSRNKIVVIVLTISAVVIGDAAMGLAAFANPDVALEAITGIGTATTTGVAAVRALLAPS